MALATVFLASWPPTVWVAARSLEYRYVPAMPPSARPVDAVVVLSGAMLKSRWGGQPTPGIDTYERLVYTVELYSHWPGVPIVVTGGKSLGPGYPSVATIMERYLSRNGIPGTSIETESVSRNTYENARLTAALLHRQGRKNIAVVTDAQHMLRAELAFSAQGLNVVPAPCCFASEVDDWTYKELLPSWWALETMEGVLHEWLGLAVYKLRGWI
jgi:uncharacterized SAM-binding protein YcdF (DUF218 family)